jgi:fatty-acyl-CoA synthase
MKNSHNLRIFARAIRWLPAIRRARQGTGYTSADLIETCARRFGDRVFVEFDGRTTSYAEFNREANRVAHWALELGLGKGDVVALMMENRPEYLSIWAGLAKAGVTTALINTHLSGLPLEHVIESAACRALVLGDECLPAYLELAAAHLKALPRFLSRRDRSVVEPGPAAGGLTSLDAELRRFPTVNPPASVRDGLRSDDPLFYIYTSGTTGLPKAARFSHSRFVSGGMYHLLSGFGARDALYCPLPLYHSVGGVICVNAVLLTGARLVLRRSFSASHFWQDIVESGATTFQYIGEMCRYLLAQPPGEYDRRHRVRYAVGNGLRPDIWEEFTRRFNVPCMVEFYGATESNVALVNLQGRPGSIGRLMPGIKATLVRYDVEKDAHVRDAAGLCVECAAGEPGEMLGRIASGGKSELVRFEGYTSAEATRAKILHDVREHGDTWFRSGDLLKYDRDGFYYFVDRIGDSFRWKGENVSTQEVEEVLAGYPGVDLAVAYGVEVPGAEGRAGMAALASAGDLDLTSAEFFRHVEQLPAYARPVFLRVIGQVDMTGTFKVRKVELQRQGFDPDAVHAPVHFRDDAAGCYRVLDAETFRRLREGGIRF